LDKVVLLQVVMDIYIFMVNHGIHNKVYYVDTRPYRGGCTLSVGGHGLRREHLYKEIFDNRKH
jgi:hypothetical protein